jgi:hypothetical protein
VAVSVELQKATRPHSGALMGIDRSALGDDAHTTDGCGLIGASCALAEMYIYNDISGLGLGHCKPLKGKICGNDDRQNGISGKRVCCWLSIRI